MNDAEHNRLFQAASKLAQSTDDLPHFRLEVTSILDCLEMQASRYLEVANILREACIHAPPMDIAPLLRMADTYRNRRSSVLAFVHSVRCRPDFLTVARKSGILM